MRRYHSYLECLIAIAFFLGAASPACADWISGGVLVSAGGGDRQPEIATDGARGAIIAWRNDTGVYIQRVGFTGGCRWVAGGVQLSTTGTDPAIVADGAGGAVVAWRDFNDGDIDIYAQRVDSTGSLLWSAAGVEICTAAGIRDSLLMVADPSGGTVIAWRDERDGEGHIYAQRVDVDGVVLWAADGVRVDAGAGGAYAPGIDTDGAGGAYVMWATLNATATEFLERKIFLTRVGPGGQIAWDPPTTLCNAGPWSPNADVEWSAPAITRDGYGRAIVAWTVPASIDPGDIFYYYIHAQKVDREGLICWEEGGVTVHLAMWGLDIQMEPDWLGGAIITWLDMTNIWIATFDVLAQRIDGNGVTAWDSPEYLFFAFRAPGSAQMARKHHLCGDGKGKYYAAFERLLYLDEDMLTRSDIYANMLDRDGLMWLGNGTPVCTAAGDQLNPRIVSAGDGSSITAWEDPRDGGSIYAQLLNAWGEQPIATLLQSQAVSFGNGAVTVEWALSEAGGEMEFYILRAEAPDGVFEELTHPVISREGLRFAFRDEGCEPGVTYFYAVDVQDGEGRRRLFETEPVSIPAMPLALYQNHPNPFNPATTIRYYLPERVEVDLGIYDAGGRLVTMLAGGARERGYHEAVWTGTDEKGTPVASGVYFCRLRAGKERISRKMLLLR